MCPQRMMSTNCFHGQGKENVELNLARVSLENVQKRILKHNMNMWFVKVNIDDRNFNNEQTLIMSRQ